MNTKTQNFLEYKLLTNNIVFADGLTRTGKGLLSHLLLGFENFSSVQFINPLEQLLPMYIHKKISKNAISSFMRLYLNENFYNYKLSRNLNFRYDDLTSIHKTQDSSIFFRNLGKEDGDKVIEEILQDDTIYQFQTHDLLTQYKKFLDLGIKVLLIELFRHPADTVYSWYMRGWGKRFDNEDPRSGTTLFRYNEFTIPHYVIGHEDEYTSLNEMEKCVFMHNMLLKKSIKEYKNLSKKNKYRILLLKYEDLLINTDVEIKKISKFLETKPTSNMINIKLNARIPRDLNIEKRKTILEYIKKQTNDLLFVELNDLIYSYTKLYNLKD